MSTIKGQYCSPGADKAREGQGSCYSKPQLQLIARAYNSKYSDTIPVTGTKEQLWTAIEKRMLNKCDTEWCWLDEVKSYNVFGGPGGELETAFRPARPQGKTQWLSTDDIHYALKLYERTNPEFLSLGPVPMDFCSLAGNEVCNINVGQSLRSGKTKIGIVFNTDPSTQGGKHWISMFIDMSDRDARNWTIDYFDSYGEAPLAPELRHLIQKLMAQNPNFKLNLNCRGEFCTTSVRHQRGSSECGVYSINFIAERLKGRKWDEIVHGARITDEQMVDKRGYYFRPAAGVSRR